MSTNDFLVMALSLAAAASLCRCDEASAQVCSVQQTQELQGDLPLYYFNGFAQAIAISGDTLLVGDWGDDYAFDPKEPNPDACDGGAAYIFVHSGGSWTQQAKIQYPQCGEEFGFLVALDGDTAVIGGAHIFVFVRTGTVWTQQTMLDTNTSIAVDDDTIVIGAMLDDDQANNAGAAHVLTRSGTVWSEQVKLVAIDAQPWDQLGSAVKVQGDTAFISTDHSVYIFERDGTSWAQVQELFPSTPTDFYGDRLSVDGDTLIVGSKFDDEQATNAGAAYVYVYNGSQWELQQKLLAETPNGENFGLDVAVSGDLAIICANNDVGDVNGAAYLFTRSAGVWTQTAYFANDNPDPFDDFANGVAFDGTWAAIAGDFEFIDQDEEKYNPGAAWIFNIDCPAPCPADLTDDGGGEPDGSVNVFDLFVLLSNWNTSGQGAALAPDTGIVDVFDLFVLLDAWGDC